MSIEYETAINNLTEPASYSLRTRPRDTVSTERLAALVAGSTSMSPADVLAVLTAAGSVILDQLLAGNSVQVDGFGILGTSLRGKLSSPTDPLPDDVGVDVTYRSAPELLDQLRARAEFTRIDPSNQNPLLLSLTSVSGPTLPLIKSGTVLRLEGDRLKVNVGELNERAAFITSTGTQLTVATYVNNGDRELTFIVPDGIVADTGYTLTIFNRRRRSVQLRSSSWHTELIGTV